MKVFTGSDHAGLELKKYLNSFIKDSMKHELEDIGVYNTNPADYPDIALEVMRRVLANEGSRGVLICSTGQGMNMSSNCYKRIRTALCSTEYEARMSREHNDANILALGNDTVDHGIARNIVRTFLTTDFSNEERHRRKVEKMEELKRELKVGWMESLRKKLRRL